MVKIEQLVSPQTLEKFIIYERLLREWNRRTGLVQEDTIAEFYTRHILDSLQIIPIIMGTGSVAANSSVISLDDQLDGSIKLDLLSVPISNLNIIDIGSGAGFPGLVLAMCGFKNLVLCESNHKKCIFLEEVARQTKTHVTVSNDRVENLSTQYDIILSRAFSDLDYICSLMSSLSATQSSAGIFHKGRSWQREVEKVHLKWNFDLEIYQSITSKDSVVLCVKNIIAI